MNSKTLQTIILIAGIIGVIAGLLYLSSRQQTKDSSFVELEGITLSETNFDFGNVSMAKGIVTHDYILTNVGGEFITMDNAYTSCMCTTATIIIGGEVVGTYGMPGHGGSMSVGRDIEPAGEAVIRVAFDPSAHGPAGIGRIDRIVRIETDDNRRLELAFTANVTP